MDNNMLQMEFTKLVLKNFRSFDDKEFNFYRDNHIFGDNGEGKSTIAEGIVFALYGVTIYGTNRTDPLVKLSSEPNSTAETEAEVTIRVGGTERVIRRIKTLEETAVFCDGVKTSQKLLQEKVLRRLDPKQFLMAFSPLFFDTLETGSLKKLIIFLAVPPSIEEVMKQLTEAERGLLGDVSILDSPTLKKQLEGQENKKTGLLAQVELLKKQIAEKPSTTSSDKDAEGIKALKDKLAALQIKKDNLDKDISKPPLAPIYADVGGIEEQVDQYRKKYAQTKGPELVVGDKCPTCGQDVSAAALQQLQGVLKNQRNEIVETAEALKTKLAEAKKKNVTAKAAYDKSFTTWQTKQTELTKLNNDIVQLNNRITATAVNNVKEIDKQKLEDDLREKEAKITKLDKDMSNRRMVIGSLNAYNVKRVELQTAKLLKYLVHVSIQLYEVSKTTGEMSETFKLLYDGKPAQFLSFSEKMRAGMELGHMFRQLTGVNIPLFLDNAESIGRPQQYDTQSFSAWFVLGREMQIIDPAEDEAKFKAAEEHYEERRKAS